MNNCLDYFRAATAQRIFKFVGVSASEKRTAMPFNVRNFYARAALESHWFGAIKSIQTPAVILGQIAVEIDVRT